MACTKQRARRRRRGGPAEARQCSRPRDAASRLLGWGEARGPHPPVAPGGVGGAQLGDAHLRLSGPRGDRRGPSQLAALSAVPCVGPVPGKRSMAMQQARLFCFALMGKKKGCRGGGKGKEGQEREKLSAKGTERPVSNINSSHLIVILGADPGQVLCRHLEG